MNDRKAAEETADVALGRRLRELRQRRGYSQQRVAEAAHLSKSFISQLERGRSSASLGTLKRICTVLDVPVWALLDDASETGAVASAVIIREDERRVRRVAGSEIDISLLTPDLNRQMEVTMSVLQPGEGYGREAYTHQGEEFGLVLSGTYEVTIDDVAYTLYEGDSIYFSSRLPHRTRVLGDEPAVTFWAVTPPS
ncbi:cupin domain-containing protein [Aeromicrobium phragmitis]|uniref:Cupin domain-containing protein n=1 Tax=Aeromicrobium phragmitis TaxID=2478914 RepID=A0A3L8PLG9_9ACTN|nr:XRE family transcriptional regulator [Aeromicrobium phragmitis]RLV56227.1 cupin domain-containing protein [Aeromicrobium phragmitis]